MLDSDVNQLLKMENMHLLSSQRIPQLHFNCGTQNLVTWNNRGNMFGFPTSHNDKSRKVLDRGLWVGESVG